MSETPKETVSPFMAGLKCTCPRCGEGKLFKGYLVPAAHCDKCGLDYSFIDSGDGPAILIMFVAGTIVVALWAIVETMFHLSVFVHLMLWIPTTIVLCVLLLRPFKATMIALQYKNDARQHSTSNDA